MTNNNTAALNARGAWATAFMAAANGRATWAEVETLRLEAEALEASA